jgi:hypothetical protein
MSGIALYQMVDEYREALTGLADMDLDDQTLADTLEGLQGELVVKGQNVAAFTLNLEAEAAAMKEAEQRIAKRRRALENKAKGMRDYLRINMERAGITEISANDMSFKVKLMKGRPACVIDDEGSLPPDYIEEVTTTKVDKRLITQAIKDGYEVPGAHLETKPALKIE